MELKPIAIFRSPFGEKFGIPRQSGIVPNLRGRIEFVSPYDKAIALKGLEDFEMIWLIWGFSANREMNSWQPSVRPPRLGGNEHLGVFASRSPYRPNPLGLSSVKIESIHATDGDMWIDVLGADLMDGTPIYDIKPYVEYADSHPGVKSGFVDRHEWKRLGTDISEEMKSSIVSRLGQDSFETICAILSEDPRPKYQDDPEREYGMTFLGCNVKFKVRGQKVAITDFQSGSSDTQQV